MHLAVPMLAASDVHPSASVLVWIVGTAVLVARTAPVSSRHDRGLDPLGTVLLVGASVALLVGIVQGSRVASKTR
ncbi:hypothetical protein [Amycolatopsis sp. NPDC051061]|uniref:hypothetical protein n=1 Tax=Amycolatopsis sp. NPDC051061 TaxID=3155042 RepID=UPI00343A58A6